jgi:hypothetical protein
MRVVMLGLIAERNRLGGEERLLDYNERLLDYNERLKVHERAVGRGSSGRHER